MSHLVNLIDRLKIKPDVRPNEGVRVVLKPVEEALIGVPKKPIITAEKDDGKLAQDILEKIKKQKLSTVIRKLPEEPVALVSKAPEPVIKEKTKKLKLKKPLIVLEDEVEIVPDKILPEGGPQLDDAKEGEAEDAVIEIVPTKQRKRTTKKVAKGVIELGSDTMIEIGDTALERRLPPIPIFNVNVSNYYMNNREIFVKFINGIFEPYKEDLLDESKGISCEDIGKDTGELSLLTHQKIVRDYINLYTPYRGLLLYHGLGSGKTCSSIAIAEGMKSVKKVIIMTPASLRRNYIEEIKKCGDLLYRKNQYWEWISTRDRADYIDTLSGALGLPKEYISRHHGAWLVNVTKQPNYATLSSSDKKTLNDQLDEMIRNKYTFINHNGLRRDRFRELTRNFEDNIFDNAVVIIDEAHNLISRIVNKINSRSKSAGVDRLRGTGSYIPQSISLLLYEFLMNANNCRIVLLTGTPIINYPNEIAILFNILRGYIKVWNFTLKTETNKKLSKETLRDIFSREKTLDYIDYVPSSKTLSITRNPYGFENKITPSTGYEGVTNKKKERRNEQGEIERDESGRIIYDERGQISDEDFIHRIVKILKKNDITAVVNGTNYSVYTALPDTLDEFMNVFINKDTGNVTNIDKFKRRIVGLTSYFRSAQEELLPTYNRDFDRHVVNVPMSDYQFKVYEDYRREERKTEKPNKKSSGAINSDGLFKEPSSTYRIFSRLACNFVMPNPPGRPNPAAYARQFNTRRADTLLEWIKNKHFKDSDEIDPDFKIKYDEFIAVIPGDNFDDPDNQLIIKNGLDQYLEQYLQNNYRKSIQAFFMSKGIDTLFSKDKPKPVVVENPTKDKEKDKDKDKASKKQDKEALKAAKEREKEEARLIKEREKETARELARLARQQQKEDAKMMRLIARNNKQGVKPLEEVKIAIIVPFRDSEESKPRTKQLNEFVSYMETYLEGHKYKIFVIEQQEDRRRFNRGQLLNFGYDLAVEEGYNNFIFHDVDLLPSAELKKYYTTIPTTHVIHIAAMWDRYGSNKDYFGGIVAFNKDMFKIINGYPNNFWGWGGEDDELYLRATKFFQITKVNEGEIEDLEHLKIKDKMNYLNENNLKFDRKYEALALHATTWQINGLNEVNLITIVDKKTCGANCELVGVNLFDTPELELDPTLAGGAKTKAVDALKEANVIIANQAEDFVDDADDDVVMSLEEYKDEDAMLREAHELEGDEILESMGNVEYREAIKASMRYLALNASKYLTADGLQIYGPKYLAMLDNINDPEHQGLNLIYSQFRTMEGIGIFCLVLEANGFAKFKIQRTSSGWEINMSEEDMGKPCYALYTGTEDAEEREILRNIYNGSWDYIPNNIALQLRAKSSNNDLGEIIKVLMITSAGSEGINLRNTRYVHIMEPYWHPVRVEQVIGRARRICSHQGLPENLRTVEVFIYIMNFTKKQLDSELAIELKLKDVSKSTPYQPQTSDQKLFEISTIKEQLTSQLLKAVKETSVDCATHSKSSNAEGLVCLSFGQTNVNEFAYNPNYTQDENDTVAALNEYKIDWVAKKFTFKATGKQYALRMDTNQVYDYESVIRAKETPGVKPILIGKLIRDDRGEYQIIKEKL